MDLSAFKKESLFTAMKSFFGELNIPVSEVSEHPAHPHDIVPTYYKETNPAHTLIDTVYFLGMVNESAFAGTENQETLDTVKARKEDYDGLLIFGIELRERENGLPPSRTQLSEITRVFNREYNYTPVTIIFKYGDQLAFANSERLKYKQEWKEGEKVGKVSLLRDINIEHPHAGHLKIIKDLKIFTSGKDKVDSFAKLYEHWQKVFDVGILNKQFYNEIQKWYFWAVREVKFPNAPNRFDFDSDEKFEAAANEHKSKNVIRLLTRILFIWFIKEKNLIPEEIFDEEFIQSELLNDFTPQKPHGVFATGKQNSMYYRAILQNLFFATLNQEMGKREFRKNKAHRNVTNLMRYQSYFKEGGDKEFLKLMEEVVPFMNGGLFECLDKPHPTAKGKQGGDIIIYEDGFSDRVDNELEVPDFLFFDVDEDIDISDEIGSKNKIYKEAKTRGLLEILQSYKFTIAENTPVEEDVALDPELLGRVFENLLASYNPETKTTARKQTGSFYTPREIVNYMVDESLIAHLKNQISDWKGWNDEEVDKNLHALFAFDDTGNPFEDNPELQARIIKALDNCKILDPACGSGAFPMGALQKMVHILHKVDPNNTEWKQRQIDRVDKAIENLEEIEDSNFREKSIKELEKQKEDIKAAFANNELDYGRKLYLIENCIYGVDIQSIAIQISKLRFFISLIVDQKIDTTKGNYGVRPLPNLETKFVAANTLISIDKPGAQGDLFDNEEVKKLEAELKTVRHKIFSLKSPARKRELREEDKKLRNKIAEKLQENGIGNQTARQLAEWDPYDQNASSPFFDPVWMFGIGEGFDVVIGNPPYISYYSKQSKPLSKKEELTYRKFEFLKVASKKVRINSMMLFIERSLFLTRKNGITCFIQDLNILENPFEAIRKFVMDKSSIELIRYGLNEFDNVASGQVITLFKNTLNNKQFPLIVNGWTKYNVTKTLLQNKAPYRWVPSKHNNIIELIEEASDGILSNYLKSHTGVAVNATPQGKNYFIRSKKEADCYPFLKGGESIKYSFCKPIYSSYLKYDKIAEGKFNDKFDEDYFREKGSHQRPFNLRNINEYNRPRIILRQSDIKLTATFSKELQFSNYSLFNIYHVNNDIQSLLFYTVLLNSNLLSFYAREKEIILIKPGKTPQIRSGQRGPIGIKQLPLIKYNDSYSFMPPFIYHIIQNQLIDPLLSKILNALVFNLYFPDHMEEREIDVLKYVKQDIDKVLQAREFEELSEEEKEEVIEQLHQIWSNPDNEVVKRMNLFKEKSPDVLKVIMES